MNWRKGKLHVGEPRTYAAQGSVMGKMVVVLPFIFFNDGPTPIIVENLRLVFTSLDGEPLTYWATVKKLVTQEDRTLATQFAVLGREAKHLICEFQREQEFIFTSQKYPLKLEARINEKKEWVELCTFSLNVGKEDVKTINREFSAHDNMSES
jgi:hypothetical protein